jgi:HEAT repeat protein
MSFVHIFLLFLTPFVIIKKIIGKIKRMTVINLKHDAKMDNLLLGEATEALRNEEFSLAYDALQRYLLEEVDDITEEAKISSLLPIALKSLEQGDFQARWDMGKVLVKLGDRVIDPLITVLENEQKESEHRWFAARILGEFDQASVVLALVNCLQTTEDEDLQTIAAQALGNIGQSAIDALNSLLSNPETRLLAVEAFAQIPRPEVIEPLLSVVNDSDAIIRTKAIAALANFSNPRIISVLRSALGDLAASVRREAVIALGFRADNLDKSELLNYLNPLLQDFNLEICQQAAIAISKINSEAGNRILCQVLQAPQTPIPLQLSLIQSLARSENPLNLTYLGETLTLISLGGTLEIIRVLGRIETLKIEAAEILLTFFNSDHFLLQQAPIRQTIAYSLGQLKILKTATILETLANDPEPIVQLHAIAALRNFQT